MKRAGTPALVLGGPRGRADTMRSRDPRLLGAILLLALAVGCGRAATPTVDDLALDRLAEADALYERRRWAEAAVAYEEVVRRRDLIRDAWLRLSSCYAALGDRSRAAGTLDRWLRIDPTDEEARARRDALVK